jgi:hypothetical protein
MVRVRSRTRGRARWFSCWGRWWYIVGVVTARAGQAEDELGVDLGEWWLFKRERQPAALMEERLGVFLGFFAVRVGGWGASARRGRAHTWVCNLDAGCTGGLRILSRCRGRCHERF